MGKDELRGHVFVVGPELRKPHPWCVWEWDMPERNLRFLESIDPEYFTYVATLNSEHLKGEDAKRAAVAIRTAYHHSLETLFTLLGATLQAPDCVVGWIPKCKTETLRDLMRAISDESSVPNRLQLERVSWKALAGVVFRHSDQDPEVRAKHAEDFGTLWQRLAHDFLDERTSAEYNSIKHGFRLSSGGFTLAMGLQEAPGVFAPAENMKLVGASRFGSTYYAVEPIEGSPPGSQKGPHFRVRRWSMNWDPNANAKATQLAAVSIANVISFLRIANGVRENVHVAVPDDAEFEAPWSTSVGVPWLNWDDTVRETDIKRASKQELLEALGLAPKAD